MARVLVVDDDKDILSLSRRILAAAEYDVVTTESVVGALEKLRSQHFDLILSDANMPSFSGFDLIRTIRQDERFAGIPFIMLTGRREKDDIERAIQLGVNAYIVKPFDPQTLVKKVSDLLDHHSLQEQQVLQTRPHQAPVPVQLTGTVSFGILIEEIGETSLTVITRQYMDNGNLLQLDFQMTRELLLTDLYLRVQSSNLVEIDGEECWRQKLVYWQVDDATLNKIRSWLSDRQIVSSKATAA